LDVTLFCVFILSFPILSRYLIWHLPDTIFFFFYQYFFPIFTSNQISLLSFHFSLSKTPISILYQFTYYFSIWFGRCRYHFFASLNYICYNSFPFYLPNQIVPSNLLSLIFKDMHSLLPIWCVLLFKKSESMNTKWVSCVSNLICIFIMLFIRFFIPRYFFLRNTNQITIQYHKCTQVQDIHVKILKLITNISSRFLYIQVSIFLFQKWIAHNVSSRRRLAEHRRGQMCPKWSERMRAERGRRSYCDEALTMLLGDVFFAFQLLFH